MVEQPLVLVTCDVRTRIAESEAVGGNLTMRLWEPGGMYVVTNFAIQNDLTVATNGWKRYQALGFAEHGPVVRGQWLRTNADWAHLVHLGLLARPGTAIPLEDFTAQVPNVRAPSRASFPLLLVNENLSEEALEAGAHPVIGWHVDPEGVAPLAIQVEPDILGVHQFDGVWPVEALQGANVAVVGVGSIGGRVAEALAIYGVGDLVLIDPDRFLWHNMVRHVLGTESVGLHKVDALKTYLTDRWPDTDVVALAWNVISHAAHLRPLLEQVDLVVCAADGIAARRAASHLAKRAGVPAVLTCVLGDGAYGEVLRLRPGSRYGCLMCQRAALMESGGMDVEAAQEAGYGTGTAHLPMTAVGPDLWLIADLTAKASVGTLLEGMHGDERHRLPGEHAVIGLRPSDEWQPPFDFNRAGDVRWHPVPGPRPGCPTCRT